MDHSFASAFVLLLLVLDPFGSLPIFVSVMREVAPERRARVALRETTLAFAILLIIAIRMIFGSEGALIDGKVGREPLVFPLAVPLLAMALSAAVLLAADRCADGWANRRRLRSRSSWALSCRPSPSR